MQAVVLSGGVPPAAGDAAVGASMEQHASVVMNYKDLIRKQDAEMAALKADLGRLQVCGYAFVCTCVYMFW